MPHRAAGYRTVHEWARFSIGRHTFNIGNDQRNAVGKNATAQT
jgi:hypothetical protein